jgi:hypothetical protein
MSCRVNGMGVDGLRVLENGLAFVLAGLTVLDVR